MGASLGTGDKKSVDVELNIVPFIDLLSCLTAFLLVTAVWVNIAKMNIQPKGKARENSTPEAPEPQLSVLIQHDKLWVGVSRVNEFTPIENNADGTRNWARFKDVMGEQKKSGFFVDKEAVEIAAESNETTPVPYSDIISAMDIAIHAGFKQPGLADPNSLSARPTL